MAKVNVKKDTNKFKHGKRGKVTKKPKGGNQPKSKSQAGHAAGDFKFKVSSSTSGEGETLRESMMKRLMAAKFRQVNEELDSMEHIDPTSAFNSDIANFEKYHKAYRKRMEAWPESPLDLLITFIKTKVPPTHVIADFGCGEAMLAASIPNQTHSFDLFALNERVTVCDMRKTPLKDETVDVAIFCLSLMGVEVGKFIFEANRVLKNKGILKIAEVTSRFSENSATTFIRQMKKFGFKSNDRGKEGKSFTPRDQVFLLLEFIKIRPVKPKKGKQQPVVLLNPCVYKRR